MIGNGGKLGNLKYGKEGPLALHMDLRLNSNQTWSKA
jgi:hypothetical protein